jgi:Flp pilus assembly pilin Flp
MKKRDWTLRWAIASWEKGATAVEYGLLAGLIAAVIAASVSLLGEEVLAMFESVDF